MFNYIKWELKSTFAEKKVSFITILTVFLLEFIFIKLDVLDSFVGSIVSMIFSIILIISSFYSFLAGAKKTMDTYNKPTFLLESMIPIPSGKLVLSKYLIAVALNFFYIFVFCLGIYIILFQAFEGEELIEIIIGMFGEIIQENLGSFIRALVYMFLLSMGYTSFVTTLFCCLKSYFPNAKRLSGLSLVVGSIAFLIMTSLFRDMFYGVESIDLVMDVFSVILIVGGYLLTTYLIENKMEVYS